MSHDDNFDYLRQLGLKHDSNELDLSKIKLMSEDDLRTFIIKLKETGSSFDQYKAYEAFIIWERDHSARSAHTIFHAAHSLLLSGSHIQGACELALRMRRCADMTDTLQCDWYADVALAYVREKDFSKAQNLLSQSGHYRSPLDENRRLRNDAAHGRIMLGQGSPHAKAIFWRVVQEFKKFDQEGVAVEPTYLRNTLWFAMVAAARWQLKELRGQERSNVFSQLYNEVMNGVKLHDGTIVEEDRAQRRLAAQALKWATPVGRPIIAWLISR